MNNGSTGYSSVYIPPYTCFENLDGFGNPIPPGSTGIYSPGPYLSMADCLNDTSDVCAPVVVGPIDCGTFLLNFEGCGDYDNWLAGTSTFSTLGELVQHWYDIIIAGGYSTNSDGTPITLTSVQLLLEECCECVDCWSCTWDGSASGNFSCINVGNGNGQYSSEAQCIAQSSNCGSPGPDIYGCTDPSACNYYAGANIDDGSCYYPTWDCEHGVCVEQNPCLGTGAYNSWSACDAACSSSGPVDGCTDPVACNYNPSATVDDGTCVYDCAIIDHLNGQEINYLINNVAYYSWYSNSSSASQYMTGDFFPNNEFAIQTFIASQEPNRGIDADMRSVMFHGFGSSSQARSTLRITQIDLQSWYGASLGYFHTWRDYVDSAIATGMFDAAGVLSLIDPSKANDTGDTLLQTPARDVNGYNIELLKVNAYIVNAFIANHTGNPPGSWIGNQTPCQQWASSNGKFTVDCDRTFSTGCGGC